VSLSLVNWATMRCAVSMTTSQVVGFLVVALASSSVLATAPAVGNTGDVVIDNPFPYCSWWVETSTQSTNVAEPDTSAAYWTTPFAVGETAITVQGDFINARYFSLQVYDSDGQPVEVLDSTGNPTTELSTLADYRLIPESGEDNPFETGIYPDTPASFTVEIVPYDNGAPVGATSPNTLPMPPTGDFGFVMIRTYVPNSLPYPSSVFGPGVEPAASIPQAFDLEAQALPGLTLQGASGTQNLPLCSSTDGARLTWSPPSGLAAEVAPILLELVTGAKYKAKEQSEDSTLYQDVASGAGAELSFLRTKSATTPFPNGNSAYVAAPYEIRPGEAVVVFANLPTTPWDATDSGTGAASNGQVQWPVGAVPVNWQQGAPTDYQLRYLSACTYVLAPPFPVTNVDFGCATDTQLQSVPANLRAADGAMGSPRMVVVTYPGEKFEPSTVTGPFTWLPARRSNGNAIQAIALRNMLPSTTFTNSATDVTYTPSESTRASTMARITSQVMGAYYPDGYICDISTLRKLGPIECAKFASQRSACLTALAQRDGDRGSLVKERAVRECLGALRGDLGDTREYRHIRGCLMRPNTSCAHHDLRRSDLSSTLLRGADLRRTRLASADLSQASLEQAILKHAHLPGATLAAASARLADFTAADLASINARQADFRQATLVQSSLRNADLRDADLSNADLRGADLRGADLRGSNLGGADLRGADLTGARIAGAAVVKAVVDSGSPIASVPGVVVNDQPSPVAPNRASTSVQSVPELPAPDPDTDRTSIWHGPRHEP
jgi:hypothetical protein